MGWLVLGGLIAVVVHAAAQLAAARALEVRGLYGGGERPRSGRRIAALGLGIVANFLAAMILDFIAFKGGGMPVQFPAVGEVVPGGPAEGRLEAGDVIMMVDGVWLAAPTELGARIDATGGRPVELTLERRGQTMELVLQPVESDGKWRVMIKLGIADRRLPVSWDHAASVAVVQPFRQVAHVVGAVWKVVTGRDKADVAGPVAIVTMARDDPHWSERVEVLGYVQVLAAMMLFVVDALLVVAPRRRRDLPQT